MNVSIQTLLADHQDGHSNFQADYFVTVRAGGTPYGCYKQALRELFKRSRSLGELHIQRKLLLLEMAELGRLCSNRRNGGWYRRNGGWYGRNGGWLGQNAGRLGRLIACWSNWFRGPIARQKNRLRLAQKRMALEDFDRGIAETERELRRFYAQAAALKQQVGELTPERRNQLERRMWRHKLKSAAAMDLITRGVLSEKTLELLLCFPPKWRCALLEEIKDQNRLLEWFRNYEVRLPRGSRGSRPSGSDVGSFKEAGIDYVNNGRQARQRTGTARTAARLGEHTWSAQSRSGPVRPQQRDSS